MGSLLNERSSSCPVYVFSDTIPHPDLLAQVIHAGNRAPYPPPEPSKKDGMRGFFIFRTGTPIMADLEKICLTAISKTLEELSSFFGWRANSPEGPGAYIQFLKNYPVSGIPGFRTAPYIIIITEQRRFPPVEQESLAFVLAHMWIMANSLGLGIHLIPGIQNISRNQALFSMLGLPDGKYAVSGCAIGYPHEELEPEEVLEPEAIIKWF